MLMASTCVCPQIDHKYSKSALNAKIIKNYVAKSVSTLQG